MNRFVEAVVQEYDACPDALTENGAATFSTSLDSCVDFFFRAGASRGKVDLVRPVFEDALMEDREVAVRLLLWARDAREGAGERALFRGLVPFLTIDEQLRVIPKIIELGRFDDLGALVTYGATDVVRHCAANTWRMHIEDGNGLAAKWAPRKGLLAVTLRTIWGMTPKQYRKFLVNHTKVVEQQMCARDWDNINFSHVPSVAAARYNKAFYKNAPEKYAEYKAALVRGDEGVKINASAIFPHDVIRSLGHGDNDVVQKQWESLPDYVNGENVLCIVDVSGSMEWAKVSGSVTAMDVACGLGLYTAERNKGPFKDLVMNFSDRSELIKLTGKSLRTRLNMLQGATWGGSTNLQAAFDQILALAKKTECRQEDLPSMLLILSDMEFNSCVGNAHNRGYGVTPATNFTVAQQKFEAAGYTLPKVVFWNIDARGANSPVRFHESGTALVSGYSPAILRSILNQTDMTPRGLMLSTINKDRYSF